MKYPHKLPGSATHNPECYACRNRAEIHQGTKIILIVFVVMLVVLVLANHFLY